MLVIAIQPSSSAAFAQRTVTNLNKNWKFILDEDKTTFSSKETDDKNWTVLDIPHDWSFQKGVRVGGDQGQGGGYHDGGIGWYRKTIHVNKASLEKITYLCFDGVYMNSKVWINGNLLGKRPYGYISFRYDISEYLHEGENTIAVRVDNSLEPSARWYHPCGIYAPVNLVEVHPLHVSPNGIFVTTPEISKEKGMVNAEISLSAAASVKKKSIIKTTILSSDGKTHATVQKSFSEVGKPFSVKMEVENPQLWSPETPVFLPFFPPSGYIGFSPPTCILSFQIFNYL